MVCVGIFSLPGNDTYDVILTQFGVKHRTPQIGNEHERGSLWTVDSHAVLSSSVCEMPRSVSGTK